MSNLGYLCCLGVKNPIPYSNWYNCLIPQLIIPPSPQAPLDPLRAEALPCPLNLGIRPAFAAP